MKNILFTFLTLALFATIGCKQKEKQEYYEKHVVFPDNATTEQKIDMASRLVPTKQQLEWQEMELTAFLHFGINTFTGREWGEGNEDPQLFNPTELNAEQWVKALKEAGFKMAIITAKHHDGFCLWPTSTTDHSVASSPWKNGKGDVVKELKDACDKYGMKFGVYLSPWDRHAECYGDSPAYNKYFIQQLTELLTNYGEVNEVWFDGACGEGPNGKRQVYDWEAFYNTIHKLQPKAVTAIMGDDVRWVGNERGYGRETEWSATVLVPGAYQHADSIRTALGISETKNDLGSRELISKAHEMFWYPSEVDVSIRPGWFYHAEEDNQVKSLSHLVDIYFKSVGYNSVLLLNIPPDKRGLIHENDVKRIKELSEYIENTFSTNYATTVQLPVTGQQGGSFELEIRNDVPVNTLMLQEDITKGQRIESFIVEAKDKNNQWTKIAEGTTVGYKRLVRFNDTMTDRIRITIKESRADFNISNTGVYYAPFITGNVEEMKLSDIKIESCKTTSRDIPEAIDGDIKTVALENSLTSIIADCGKDMAIKGFCYVPSMDGNNEGTIFHYNLYSSTDGNKWEPVIQNGEFSNIKNNPIPQFVRLSSTVNARYLKLESVEEINGENKTAIAEFGIITE